MQYIINRIKELAILYPDDVALHPPVEETSIEFIESRLHTKLPAELIELYKFSNGLAFIDYVVVGLMNKKILNTLNINPMTLKPDGLHKEVIVFMTTELGESFAYTIDENSRNLQVIKMEESDSVFKVVAPDIRSFFEKFLDKIPVLLEYHSKDEWVTVFEDESLPEDLAKWN